MGRSIADLAELCAKVEAEPGKKRKAELVGSFLASLEENEIGPTVLFLLAQVLPESEDRSLDVGYRTVRKAVRSGQMTLFGEDRVSITEAYDTFQRIARAEGAGSRRTKEALLSGLLSRLGEMEREYLLRSLSGEMRIGVNEGVMLDAIARASGVDLETVRGAHMLMGDVGGLAALALSRGGPGLRAVGIKVFTPIRPMLAEMASGVDEVIAALGTAAFEFKLDGARVQLHKEGGEVRIFSRRLTEVTGSLPEIVRIAQTEIQADRFILEGEVVAYSDRPLPFQDVMRRMTRVHEVVGSSQEVPLRLFLFDALLIGERELIGTPCQERWEALQRVAPAHHLVPRIITSDAKEAEGFYRTALEQGHEGLVAKDLGSPYTIGKRGRRWLKIKKSTSLDLVIVAAEWGYGRREGWLSDYHLAARSGESFEEVGKTYKGFTDEEFKAITERLLALRTSETRHVVQVRPEIVVEVVFDEVQRSPKYPSGYALRLARVKSIRDDKTAREADSIETVARLYEEQFRTKGRLADGSSG
ncbi:MAG: ATP-dependent DNA ligase [Methanomassiliicoccales archaeon]|nr:ATP-dependent DNA ligase [Methanomassiliicoccales archaeon]MDD1755932.1 ATP-dependent DNA ligase [Methanomassiliicoccales archaeon]